MKLVDVIVDISGGKLDRVFQYRIPEELMDELEPGMQVEFPFGNANRRTRGYVVGFSEETDCPLEKLKTLSGIVKGSVQAESQLIALAAWMRRTCGSTMNQALKTVLPVKRQTRQRQNRKLVLALPGKRERSFWRNTSGRTIARWRGFWRRFWMRVRSADSARKRN